MSETLKKTRVWHLCSNRWNSAITEYALSACRSLEQADYENYFSALHGSPCEKRAQKYGLRCESFKSFFIFELVSFLKKMRKIRPQVIFVYGGRESSLCQVAFLLLFFLPLPKLIRFRGSDLREGSLLEGLKQRLGMAFVSKVFTPSFRLSDKMADILESSKIVTVPLGVDDQVYFRSDKDSRSPFPRPRILIFGRFDPVKGHGRALDLFSRFLRRLDGSIPRPHLWISGHEENIKAQDLRTMISQYGLTLDEDVILDVGRFSNVRERMAGSTIGWISSLGSEIICRVAEEFLLCGTPVFVSGVGALKETLYSNEAGYSYEGLDDDKVIALLLDLYRQSLQESEDHKMQRAVQARQIFSLATMGENIRKSID